MSNAETTVLGFTLPQIIDFVEGAVESFMPRAAVFGFTAKQLLNIASGIAAGVPEAKALIEQIKIANTPGAPKPTPEQWAIWNASADAMHIAIQEAAARVIRVGR